MNNSKNPIAEQSKKWLVKALISLMQEKPYKSITIKEITDKAMLSRRTFYRNFTSKEEILALYFRTICKDYIESLYEKDDLLLPNITMAFFGFWSKHLEFLRLLKENHLSYLLLDNLNDVVPDIYQIFKGKWNEYDSEEDLKYALAFSTGGLFNMLSIWLEDENIKSPKQLSKIIDAGLHASLRTDNFKSEI